MIRSVAMQSFKGQDRTVDLQPRAVVTGPNGAGKSAIADAIRFALLGFVPDAGRLPAQTVKFASGPEMSVTLQIGEKTLRRSLPATTRKASAYASWVPPSESTESHALNILRMVGHDTDEAAESLDLRQLLRAGPAIRAQRINALLDATSGDAAARWTKLRALILHRLTGAPAEVAAAVAESHLTPAQKAALDKIGERQLREWLALGIDEAIEQAKRGKKTATEAAKAFVTKPSGWCRRPSAEVDAERQKVAQEAAQLLVRIEQAAGAAKARAASETLLAGLRAVTGDPVALRAQAAAIADPAEIPAPALMATPAADPRPDELEAQARAKLDSRPEIPSTKPAEANLAAAEAALRLALESPWREVERIAQDIRNAAATDIGEGAYLVWVDLLLSLASKHGGNAAALDTAVKAAVLALSEARDAAESAKSTRAQLADEAKRLRSEADELRAADRARQADVAATNAKIMSEFDANRASRSVIVSVNATTRLQLCAQADAIERARLQLAAEEAKLAALPEATVDVELLRAKHGELTKRYAELGQEFAHAQTVERDTEANAKAQADQMLADTTRDVWAAYQWALETFRATDMAERSGPIITKMVAFFAAAGLQVTPYMRATKASVEFGWTRDGLEVSIDTMSGSETVIYCTALAAAVIGLRAPVLKVLLIEAAEVGDLWDALLAGLSSVDADNVIVTTCHPVTIPVGWQSIECQRAETVGTF